MTAPSRKPINGTSTSASQNDPVPSATTKPADRPQHEEVAVGDVDDVEQAEDDRKAESNEGNDQSPHQPVHCKREDEFVHGAAIDARQSDEAISRT